MSTCIAYLPNGNICGRPAKILDPARGGMVCVLHAPDPDARPTHPTTGEEIQYCLAPYAAMLADAEMTDDERWEWIQHAARLRSS
jgi:hypothetical protein